MRTTRQRIRTSDPPITTVMKALFLQFAEEAKQTKEALIFSESGGDGALFIASL